jgi:hypothetical protein
MMMLFPVALPCCTILRTVLRHIFSKGFYFKLRNVWCNYYLTFCTCNRFVSLTLIATVRPGIFHAISGSNRIYLHFILSYWKFRINHSGEFPSIAGLALLYQRNWENHFRSLLKIDKNVFCSPKIISLCHNKLICIDHLLTSYGSEVLAAKLAAWSMCVYVCVWVCARA